MSSMLGSVSCAVVACVDGPGTGTSDASWSPALTKCRSPACSKSRSRLFCVAESVDGFCFGMSSGHPTMRTPYASSRSWLDHFISALRVPLADLVARNSAFNIVRTGRGHAPEGAADVGVQLSLDRARGRAFRQRGLLRVTNARRHVVLACALLCAHLDAVRLEGQRAYPPAAAEAAPKLPAEHGPAQEALVRGVMWIDSKHERVYAGDLA